MDFLNLTLEEMETYFKELGEPRYRAHQVFEWVHKRHVADFSEMGNLPKALRDSLSKKEEIGYLDVLEMQASKEDGTRKYLLALKDGNAIETVFMRYKYGNSICVSSQAGCRMGCKFCASTVDGLRRNLTAGEIVSQILTVEREILRELGDSAEEEDWKVGHIVIMGTGEPLDNYDNVKRFISMVHEPEGLNIGLRNITLSTCGLVPRIADFSEDFPQVNLAISLHATTDEIRSSMMPINNRYPISSIIEAAKEYTEKTNRRITFEYTMVSGVNDSDEDAERLSELLKGMLCHVNIIPLNKVQGSGFDTVSRKRAAEFSKLLEEKGIPATVRRELGADIDGACGQLRLKSIN